MNPNYPILLEDPVLCAIAKKHKQTPALVALRYQIQRGVVVLAKSYNKKRIRENIQVMISGAVGRGLLSSILHKGHSLSSSQTILEWRQVTCFSWCMNALCVFLMVFSSCCGNKRGGMAGEGSGWTENRDFSSSTLSIYSVTLYKYFLHSQLTKLHYLIFVGHLGCSNKILKIGWLRNNWNLFLTVLKLEIWGQGACVINWGPSSRSQAFPCILTWWRGHQSSPKYVIWIWHCLNLILEGSTIMT